MLTARLAALVGCAFDEIQESHLQALVDGKVGEDQDLDFKQARYDHGPKGTFEVAKDVAAMANQVGGLIVIGIAEDDQGRADHLAAVKLDDAEKGKILQAVADRAHPLVVGLDVRMIPSQSDPATGYFLMSVPHSVMAPHAVRKDEPGSSWYCYPQRHGTTTIYLHEPQIATRYRDRFTLARNQVDRLARLHEQAYRQRSDSTVLLAVGIVPAVAGSRPMTGEGPTLRTYFDEVWKARGSRVEPKWGKYQIARGCLRSVNAALVAEIHQDGAAWAQLSVGRVPGQDVCLLNLVELEQAVVILTAMLGGYTAWAGAGGDAAVGAWLYDGPRKIGIDAGGGAEWVALPLEGATTTAPVIELGGTGAQAGQIAYPLIRDLEQDMGIAQPVALRPDGTGVMWD